jgi:PAS domain S-box-containing protein
MQLAQTFPFLIALIISSLIALGIALFALRRRYAVGAHPLIVLAIAIVIWAAGYAMELSQSDPAAMIGWARIEYLGIVLVPVAWFWYALQYTGHDRHMRPRQLAYLLVIPLLTTLVIWTNEAHGLFWSRIRFSALDTATILTPAFGTWFWIHTTYSYILVLSGAAMLVRLALRTHPLYRRQATVLVFGAMTPLIGNMGFLLFASQDRTFDITPMLFVISLLVVTWGLTREQLLETPPVARDLVIDQMRDGVVVINEQELVVDINPAARDLLNRPVQAVIGRHLTELLPQLQPLLAGHRGQVDVQSETELSVNGRQRCFDVRLVPLAGWNQQDRGWLLLLRDITAQRAADRRLRLQNAELLRAKEAAEAANRAKSTFVANISHELRTPLTSIIGYSQLMRLQIAMKDYGTILGEIDTVEKASQHLLEMINKLLDLAKIEAGRTELSIEQFAIPALLDEVVMMVRPLTDERQNTLRIDSPPDLGEARTDRGKLRQVLINLLGNAAKFTENGSITLRAAYSDNTDSSQLEIQVIDTGIGIPAEALPTLFTEFTQVHSNGQPKSRYGGTGLGLAICKRYAGILGGSIGVESTYGQGSQFTVRIPLHPAQVSEPAAPQAGVAVDPEVAANVER